MIERTESISTPDGRLPYIYGYVVGRLKTRYGLKKEEIVKIENEALAAWKEDKAAPGGFGKED